MVRARWISACAAVIAAVLLAFPALAVAAEEGAVRPVPGPVVDAFAPPAQRYGAGHRGVDLAAGPGALVRVALSGVVLFAGPVAGANWVTVDHGGGLQTTYGVLASLSVSAGDEVTAGDVIGTLAPGRAHLDWGAKRDGAYVDPLDLLVRLQARLVDPDTLRQGPGPLPAVGQAIGAMVRPVAGAAGSGFGMRIHPITGERRLHAGLDIAAPLGTPIVAAAGGLVAFAGSRGGYGLVVVLDHGGGLETRYAHASALDVISGQPVRQGQVIARVGSTGLSTGPHLHFEVRVDGRARDPTAWLPG